MLSLIFRKPRYRNFKANFPMSNTNLPRPNNIIPELEWHQNKGVDSSVRCLQCHRDGVIVMTLNLGPDGPNPTELARRGYIVQDCFTCGKTIMHYPYVDPTQCEYLSEKEFVQGIENFEQNITPEGKELMERLNYIMQEADLTDDEKRKRVDELIDETLKANRWIN